MGTEWAVSVVEFTCDEDTANQILDRVIDAYEDDDAYTPNTFDGEYELQDMGDSKWRIMWAVEGNRGDDAPARMVIEAFPGVSAEYKFLGLES